MANEKRLIDTNLANADCCSEKQKIKTHFAKIIVEGTAENPYYSILYYDPTEKEYYNGYGSYYIENVFNWLSECFEIDESPVVDAVEVVHGRWNTHDRCGVSIKGFMACSACNVMIPTADNNHYCLHRLNYCPNCGAKMDGDGNG